MEYAVSAWGALIGLAVAIFLIIYRVAPTYSLIAGAFLGGLLGGADPKTTIDLMVGGAKDIVPATMRIITAGVLAGVLIESGAARRIAETITRTFGEHHAPLALALATMLLTTAGVFIDIAVITVSPIALAMVRQTGISTFSALFAMIGGGKAGNVISPNPNTISAAKEFQLDLASLMAANIVPALFGLAATVIIARFLFNRDRKFVRHETNDTETETENSETESLPWFGAAILGPVTAIALLALRPISRLSGLDLPEIDPMIALPAGGIVGCLAMGRTKQLVAYSTAGLGRMTGVAILLLGTGTIAGIIKNSTLITAFKDFLAWTELPGFVLAPVSGVFMSAATASTTAGTTVASQSFGPALLDAGVGGLAAAAMIHTGATVLDHLPHGSFFHATGGAMGMSFGERLKLIPLETAIGLVLVGVSTVIYGIFLS